MKVGDKVVIKCIHATPGYKCACYNKVGVVVFAGRETISVRRDDDGETYGGFPIEQIKLYNPQLMLQFGA